ncbi:hypothetical protein TNCV_3589891 [Trichonephila clavipes]|nr:hypothetical protein TNCV_3589891 [Trichonephila clavipes]
MRISSETLTNQNVQYATYPANKQAKEEVACVGLKRSLEFVQHMGVEYPVERKFPLCLEERKRLRAQELHGRTWFF